MMAGRKRRFDNTVGNMIKSGEQRQAERDIKSTSRLTRAAQVIVGSMLSGKPVQERDPGLKQDIANVMATAGKRRGMGGKVAEGSAGIGDVKFGGGRRKRKGS